MKRVILALAVWGIAGSALAKDHFSVGETVPMFTLKAINPEASGESYVSIDKYYGPKAKDGKKATLISFFATYCGPCKREIPYLAALHKTYRDKGLQVLMVSIDKDAEKIDEARQLADKSKVEFPVLSDRFNIVARRYLIEKLPCVYILDSGGKVSMVNVGYDGDVTKVLLDEVRRRLGESVSDAVPEDLKSFMNHDEPAKVADASTTKSDAPIQAADDSKKVEVTNAAAAVEAPAEPEPKPTKKTKKKKRRRKRKR